MECLAEKYSSFNQCRIMAIFTAFIGINKYADADIRDLAGARRDATALWALFRDTIPDAKAELFLDEQATLDKVRTAFDQTLGAAGEEDTVVLSFAGHGTHDHRLVLHSTYLNDLEKTTIPMAELAKRFKDSKAKVILCILDCCFSGDAPARVLENSPIPRATTNPFYSISGKGRILIAASNFDEVAYEMPGGGHGLLTNALLQVLQEGEGSFEAQAAMAKVMESVRAAAARIGVTQTPILLGHIEGGLTFPVLKPGEHYHQEFPESKGVRIGAAIADLSHFDFPDSVLSEWADRFKSGLNDLQLEAVNEYRILDGESLFVVAPTSSGKTFVGEMTALKGILKGRKAVFLLPYKALTNEKFEQFSRLYGDRLGLRVIRCTGDRLDDVGLFIRGKYDLALLTYEMFLGLALSAPGVLNQIGLVVLDEAQFITDPTRGITVELLLTYLITAREKGINPQLIILSAVIGDVNNFESWLGCAKLVTTVRPVPLVEGVLDRSGSLEFLDTDGQAKTRQLLPFGSVIQRREKPSSQDVIVPLVKKLISENPTEQVIIFRNRKGPAAGCANYLAAELGLPPAANALNELPAHDLSSNSARLRQCLQGGTAFHNTNLSPEEKEVVERAFRDSAGNIRVLGATTTVAAGINTPASTVILAEQEFIGDDGRAFTIAEYKNMAGRAGRLGFSENGQSIILADNQYDRATLFQRYVLGELEPLKSSFDPQHIETWIIRLLAQVGRINRKEVSRLLANTYGGYLANRVDPNWRIRTEQSLDRLLTEFISLGLVEEDSNEIHLTLLGQVCGRSSLLFSSAMRLISLLKAVDSTVLTPIGLVALTQGLPELDHVYIPIAKAGRRDNRKIVQSETQWPGQAVSVYGHGLVQSLQKNADDFFAWYARCKRALILSDWMKGVPMETIEQRYSVNAYNAIEYGHVQSIASITRFHLRAASQIASVIFIDKAPADSAIETLLKQLEVGLPEDALGLLDIPAVLTRGQYLALYGAGVKAVDQLWRLPSEEIDSLVGKQSASQLEKMRPVQVNEASPYN